MARREGFELSLFFRNSRERFAIVDSASQRSTSEQVSWLFDHFELAPHRGRLMRDGSEVALPPKSFETLVHLVRHRERVVPRNELVAVIWLGAAVSDAAIASAIRDMRRALGDVARRPRFVVTVRGRGLRFVHPVREAREEIEQTKAGAWDAAAIHFERAIRALELVETSRGRPPDAASPQGPRQRGALIVALARVRWAAGAPQEAREAFVEAANVARRSGDAEVLAQAALGFAGRSDVTPGVNREAVGLLEEARAAMPERDSALRAEILARLGTELYYDENASRSDVLTHDALRMAERLGDRAMIAYASTARHFSRQRPEVSPQERIALADRVISLTGSAPASDILVLGLQERLIDLFELGDGDAFDDTFRQYEKAVVRLDQPFFIWMASLFRGTRTLLAGDIDDAEQLAHATLAIGTRLGTPNAQGAFAGQIFSIRREQGRLGELAPALEAAATRHPALAVYRAGRAAVAAAAGTPENASLALEDVMSHDLDDFPRDQNWIATLGTLAPVAVAARSEPRIRQLLGFLRPYAGRMIVVGQGATTHGAVSHHLGLLHAALGENRSADTHFQDAAALHERMRAPLWLKHTLRAREAL